MFLPLFVCCQFTMDDGIFPALSIRSSVGVELWTSGGLKIPYEPNSQFARDESKNCRVIVFSPDGRFFAWANGTKVRVSSTTDWSEICSLPRPKAFYIKFSPRGNYIMTWETFSITKDSPDGGPNLYVYKSDTGEEVFSTIQKKQTDWEPCWSADETIFGLMVGGEAFFYELESPDGFSKSVRKLGGGRNGLVSIAPGNSPPFLAYYVPGAKDTPSMCKIYKYPALAQNQAIACKSFFQADRVEMIWNKRGSGLLLLTSTEVDQSGASYYGKQALNFMTTKGDSFSVPLAKEGPVHAVAWSPKGNEFCIVYGYMPAKATLFNLKCDVVFDFGEGSRNCCYFNNFGNLLILAGFGNLRGYVEIWDMNKRSQLSTLQAPDSTLLEWSPCGEIFVTATTAPRLRIANGFKVWHYSGALLHETLWPEGQELLEVSWQKYSDGTFKENPISNVKIEGIKSSQPEASKQVYQPPNVRLSQGRLSFGDLKGIILPGMAQGSTTRRMSNSNNRHRKQKKPQGNGGENSNTNNSNVPADFPVGEDTSIDSQTTTPPHKPAQPRQRRNTRGDRTQQTTGDPEKDKKIKNIHKKLQDISKLKSKQKTGEKLQENQLVKINAEQGLIAELRALKMPSSGTPAS